MIPVFYPLATIRERSDCAVYVDMMPGIIRRMILAAKPRLVAIDPLGFPRYQGRAPTWVGLPEDVYESNYGDKIVFGAVIPAEIVVGDRIAVELPD